MHIYFILVRVRTHKVPLHVYTCESSECPAPADVGTEGTGLRDHPNRGNIQIEGTSQSWEHSNPGTIQTEGHPNRGTAVQQRSLRLDVPSVCGSLDLDVPLIHTHMHASTRVNAFEYQPCMYSCICSHTYMNTHIIHTTHGKTVCVHICIHIYIYIYIYISAHVYMYIYIYLF